jgi:CBS domain-containing protein
MTDPTEADMKVSELCSHNVASIPGSASVVEAARLMCEHGVGAVIVTAAPADSPIVVGILTDRDIVLAQLDRAVDLSQLRIADVMAADPLVLNEEDPVDEAIRRMRARAVRRAPVISRSGQLTGVVSFDDLLAYLSANLARLAQITDRARRYRDVSGASQA